MLPLAPLALKALPYLPSAIKGLGGLLGIGKGNRAAKNNKRPVEKVNPLFQKNVALAENAARVGMPQQQYNNRLNLIQRGLSGALSRFGRNGGSTGSLASIVRGGNDATADLVADDSRDRQQNQRFAFGQRAQLANEQNRVWDYNHKQKYEENAASIAQQIGAGKQNAFGALNDMTQLGMLGKMSSDSDSSEPQDYSGMLGGGDGSTNIFKRMFGGRVRSNQLPRV